jgi:hypothetical protein
MVGLEVGVCRGQGKERELREGRKNGTAEWRALELIGYHRTIKLPYLHCELYSACRLECESLGLRFIVFRSNWRAREIGWLPSINLSALLGLYVVHLIY